MPSYSIFKFTILPGPLRVSAEFLILSTGPTLDTTSKQLGHASVTTTESFYSHIIEESKAQAAECLADVMLRHKKA